MNRADPNDTLVQHLIGLGYTSSQISSAQETLWNAVGSGEGGYDDVVAVEGLLRQLHKREEESSGSEYETDTDLEEEEEGELKGGSGELIDYFLGGWAGSMGAALKFQLLFWGGALNTSLIGGPITPVVLNLNSDLDI
jgi:hypothetical protein